MHFNYLFQSKISEYIKDFITVNDDRALFLVEDPLPLFFSTHFVTFETVHF